MARELRIDKFRILQLLNNSGLVQMLPPLQELASKKTVVQKKSCCGGSRTTGPSEADRDAALRAMANLLLSDPELKAAVKSKLGADLLRIRYKKIGSQMTVEAKI